VHVEEFDGMRTNPSSADEVVEGSDVGAIRDVGHRTSWGDYMKLSAVSFQQRNRLKAAES
jgi:hypothetical protein